MSTIHLNEPAAESVTASLQAFAWEGWEGAASPDRWDDLKQRSDDRSLPRPLRFSWTLETAPAGVEYTLSLARDPGLAEAFTVSGLTVAETEVRHLHVGTRYYWKVAADAGGAAVAESEVAWFDTHPEVPRWIHVPGMTNVRDTGGWPLDGGGRVRQGLLYRSSEMDQHMEIKDEGREVLIEELGIRTDLDLRETDVAIPVLDADVVNWINVMIVPYQGVAEPEWQDAYRRVFEVLAEPERYPILFHCWGGCDRAGTIGFLVGGLLGMAKEDINREFELSGMSIWGHRRSEHENFRFLFETMTALAAEGAALKDGVEAYLLSVGVTPGQIRSVREILTEAE